jgi:hypothetical protein
MNASQTTAAVIAVGVIGMTLLTELRSGRAVLDPSHGIAERVREPGDYWFAVGLHGATFVLFIWLTLGL